MILPGKTRHRGWIGTVTGGAFAFRAFEHLAGGLSVGICGMAGGMCIGVLGNWGVRSSALRPQMFMSAVLMTGFAMVLGMYGLIVALLQAAK